MSPFFVEKTCFFLTKNGLITFMSIKQLNKERRPLTASLHMVVDRRKYCLWNALEGLTYLGMTIPAETTDRV